jgi:hypothetical protein
MLTKKQLKYAIDVYTNANSGYLKSLGNTLMFWSSTKSRGIFRTFVKDSPQYLIIKDFMSSPYMNSLGDNDEVDFIVFNEYVIKNGKGHRFSSDYIHGDNAVVTTIIKPWFNSLSIGDQKLILFANDEVYKLTNKSLTHHSSEFKDGLINSVISVGRLVSAPIQSTNHIITALAHLPQTLDHLGKNIVNRPIYTLASQIPALLVGHAPGVANFALANAPFLQGINYIPTLPVALPIHPDYMLLIAENADRVIHVAHAGGELNQIGECDVHHQKYSYHL